MTTYSNDAKYVAKLQLIEQQIASNQLPLAAQGLNALLKNNPQDPRIFLLGSRMARAANNKDGEFQLALRAHQVAPDWPPATIFLADVLAARGQADDAVNVAERAAQQAVGADNSVELLLRAATVAYQFGANDKALRWFSQANDIQPGQASTRYKMALTLMASGDYTRAVDILDSLLAEQPGRTPLLAARLSAHLSANQTELALQDAQALAAQEPDNEEYKFYLAFLRGENPKALPESLTGQLFNNYAGKFDRHLVTQLHYKLPRDVARLIHTWHPDKKVDVLDLGCGTGLLGVCLGPLEGVLVGVDLSREMIDQALRHGVYHRFHQVNLLDALKATPVDQYHVIAALDVLNYIGDLDSVMTDALRILLPGGRLVFSCELSAEGSPDFSLQKNLRFSHTQNYVENLLQRAGFGDITLEPVVLRYEAGQPVQGLLVTACKPSEVAEQPASSPTKATNKTLRQA